MGRGKEMGREVYLSALRSLIAVSFALPELLPGCHDPTGRCVFWLSVWLSYLSGCLFWLVACSVRLSLSACMSGCLSQHHRYRLLRHWIVLFHVLCVCVKHLPHTIKPIVYSSYLHCFRYQVHAILSPLTPLLSYFLCLILGPHRSWGGFLLQLLFLGSSKPGTCRKGDSCSAALKAASCPGRFLCLCVCGGFYVCVSTCSTRESKTGQVS